MPDDTDPSSLAHANPVDCGELVTSQTNLCCRLFSRLKITIAICVLSTLYCVPSGFSAQAPASLLASSRRTVQEEQQDAAKADEASLETVAPKRDLISLEQIDQELVKVENTELEEAEKTALVKHYLAARQFLTLSNTDAAEAARFRDEAENVVKTREELRAAIEKIENTDDTSELPKDELASLEQLKQTLDSETERNEEAAKLANEEPGRRRARLSDLTIFVDEAQNKLAEVRVQLAIEAPKSDDPMLTRARMVELRAEQQYLEQRLALFRIERDAYESTSGILPLRKTLASKQLERSTKSRSAVVTAIGKLKKDEIQRLLSESKYALECTPELLAPVAQRNVDLAQLLADETEILQETRTLRSEGQTTFQKIEAELETMRSRVEAIGLSYEFGAMLRRDKSKLINQQAPFLSTDVAVQLQRVQLDKYQWQDERSELSDMSVAVTAAFDSTANPKAAVPESDREALVSVATELLESRRHLLEKLEDTESDLLHDLLKVQALQSMYVNKRNEFADFLDERILWVRSEPALGFGDIGGIRKATKWFAKRDNWAAAGEAIAVSVKKNQPSVTMIVVGLLGLILLQPRCRSEIKSHGVVAAKRGCREFSPTLSVLLQTIVLAIFWPAIGLAIGWLIAATTQNDGSFADAIGHGLTVVSMVALPLELLRCVCRREGLAQNHFAWTEGFRVAVRRHSGWFMAVGLPLLFVIVATEASGNSEYSRLGRVAILGLLAVSIVYTLRIFAVFRPGGKSYDSNMTGFDATVHRIRSLVFVIVIIGFILLFLFAVLGYYESVYKIGSSLLQTVQVLIWTVIAFGVAMRFFLVRRRKLRFEQLIQQRKAAIAAAEKQAESGMTIASEALDIDLQNESGMDITDVSRQARELTGVIFLIVVGLILLGIWQYLLPATKILERVELWRITVGTAVEFVTARDLLLSLVAFAITFFSVRNIPGMLELLLLQRLPLDAGARYAVASILRYILLVVGVIFALGFLKIPWSNYSWLVAAISVGLGFGLQEIVANFVSGLILLLERPVRVGDVVTIDGVTGIVSRIQMRATTVTNWDNQELVVPNKDLISGKLLNWTLSSVINRIAIKVGVAYGTDIGKVREIISKIVERHPDVLQDPPPIITFEEFGDSSLNFVIRCCTTSIKRRWHLMDEINTAVNEAFEREGIEIPFPQRVVHMVGESSVTPDSQSQPDA